MPQLLHYETCPACRSHQIERVLQAKDNTVSGEIFSILHCRQCTLRFTQDVPAAGDIGRYYQSGNYVSHSDTKKGIINRLYHMVRNFTLVRKKNLVRKASGMQTGSLLDIGAGTGAFAHTMQSAGWQVTALEPDETARQNALKNYGLPLQLPETLFSLPGKSFDVITLWHVLEHVHDLHRYLDTFRTLLKPNGTLIVAVPNYTSYDAAHYGECWAAYDVPRHLYHFSPQSMRQLLQQYSFAIADMKPMPFDSFYVSMLSEQYRHGSNRYANAFATGLRSNSNASGNPERSSSVIYIARLT